MLCGERVHRLRDRGSVGNLEVLLVATEALAKHGEVENVDAHRLLAIVPPVRPQRILLQSPAAWLLAALVFTAADAFAIQAVIEHTGRLRILAVIAGPVALVAWLTMFTGLAQLRIDVAAGTIEYRKGRTRKRIRLDELGALTITKRKPVTTNRTPRHVLEAPGFPDVDLFAMVQRKPVVEMQARLERAVTRARAKIAANE
jgi:hypothetical protein